MYVFSQAQRLIFNFNHKRLQIGFFSMTNPAFQLTILDMVII